MPDVAVWEITNPCDTCTMEATDHDVATTVVVLLGNGFYGAHEVDGDRHVPIMLFAADDVWSTKTFGCTVTELAKRTVETKREAVIAAFESVLIASKADRASYNKALDLIDDPLKRDQWRTHWNDTRRSSVNNIGGRAAKFAASLRAPASAP